MRKSFIFIFFLNSLQFWDCYAFSDGDNCDSSFMRVEGNTISECRESAASYSDDRIYKSCIGVTSWMATWASLESDCNKKVMNKTLDERLFSLKRSVLAKNKRYFTSEMSLQASFLEGVKRYCYESYSKCQGSMWIPSQAGCPSYFYEIRHNQGELINRGSLQLPEVDKNLEKIKSQIPLELFKYAFQICSMPFDVWKDGKAPPNCVDRVLSSFKMHPDLCLEY
jgi:hypothetical protein